MHVQNEPTHGGHASHQQKLNDCQRGLLVRAPPVHRGQKSGLAITLQCSHAVVQISYCFAPGHFRRQMVDSRREHRRER